ncbi:MAG TPA: DUF362 domain-containing protein, partial [Methanomassiliicoccales archaeon]|nr:DUF362 domain-containing protein [Methanomassiliicoccales archaeon]
RSGPADTHQVFEDKGIFELARSMKFIPIVVDEIPLSEFVKIMPENGHWSNGFYFAKMAQTTDVIGLCCLKTHAYGGHFTMSLKLATGLVHRRNMTELHSSLHMREMIAEMNLAYRPRFMIMDGVEAFFDGGPMAGSIWRAGLSLASEDRVALDAVGVAALKMHGTTKEIETKKVFEQTQIRHAARLGLGADKTEDIELRAVDEASQDMVDRLSKHLYDGS